MRTDIVGRDKLYVKITQYFSLSKTACLINYSKIKLLFLLVICKLKSQKY